MYNMELNAEQIRDLSDYASTHYYDNITDTEKANHFLKNAETIIHEIALYGMSEITLTIPHKIPIAMYSYIETVIKRSGFKIIRGAHKTITIIL